MTHSKTFSPGSRSSSNLYRLLDMAVLAIALYSASTVYSTRLDLVYFAALTTIIISYSYIAELFSLYRSWRAGRFRFMILQSWASLLVAFLVLLIVAFLFKFTEQLSRITLLLWSMFSLFGLFLYRLIVRQYRLNCRKRGLLLNKVAIIGATDTGFELLKELLEHDELGYQFSGFYDDREPSRIDQKYQDYVIGTIQEAVEQAAISKIDTLFVALPLKAEQRIDELLTLLSDTMVDVHIVPDFLLKNFIQARIEHVGEMDTLSVFESPMLGARDWVKRTEDLIVGSLILLLISPILILIGLGVKLTSPGPILFKQDRYGLGGERIKVWKFRTMKVMENKDVVKQAQKNDPRITQFGAFLRRTSLDELPQFINVITGQMSIVGPRPHAVSHNEEYRKKVEYYMLRHKIKPGITGWAQINGWRGETDTLDKMAKRVEFDLYYLRHWSLWFDVKVIFLTIFKGFVGKNAY